jgi:hypothetical protein
VGLAALATIAAARTASAHGQLVQGYQLSFLICVGFVVAALLIVLIGIRPRATSVAAPSATASQ